MLPGASMNNTHHAAVWLDHQEAHVFYIGPDSFREELVLPTHPHRQLHRKAGPGADSGRRVKEDQVYYEDVMTALSDSAEILIVGPATAKLELIKHIHKHRHDMAQRIVGVETVDHPTDRQIVAYARQYFHAADAKQKAPTGGAGVSP
jgi:stalled ribosome rescue protein Dom34